MKYFSDLQISYSNILFKYLIQMYSKLFLVTLFFIAVNSEFIENKHIVCKQINCGEKVWYHGVMFTTECMTKSCPGMAEIKFIEVEDFNKATLNLIYSRFINIERKRFTGQNESVYTPGPGSYIACAITEEAVNLKVYYELDDIEISEANVDYVSIINL